MPTDRPRRHVDDVEQMAFAGHERRQAGAPDVAAATARAATSRASRIEQFDLLRRRLGASFASTARA